MQNNLKAKAVIRHIPALLIAVHSHDADGPFTPIEVTDLESGGLIPGVDDVIVDGHITSAEFHAIVSEYEAYGRMLPREAPQPVLADVVEMPVRTEAPEVAA